MKLLIDINLSPAWTKFLSDANFPSVHWSTIGAADATDAELMAYAVENDCVFLTHDLDFSAILAATHGRKPSVMQIRSDDLNPEHIGNAVVSALPDATTELETGAVVSLTADNTRLRILPLTR